MHCRWHDLTPEPWGLSWDPPTWTCNKCHMASQKCWRDHGVQMLRLPILHPGPAAEALSALGLSLWCHRVSGPEQGPSVGNMLLLGPEGLSRCFYFIIMIGGSRVNHFLLFKGDARHWTSDTVRVWQASGASKRLSHSLEHVLCRGLHGFRRKDRALAKAALCSGARPRRRSGPEAGC